MSLLQVSKHYAYYSQTIGRKYATAHTLLQKKSSAKKIAGAKLATPHKHAQSGTHIQESGGGRISTGSGDGSKQGKVWTTPPKHPSKASGATGKHTAASDEDVASTTTPITAARAQTKLTPIRKVTAGGTTAHEVRRDKPLTDEEMLEQVEMIRAMSRMFPTADPWGQRVDTLDVIMPHSTHSHFPSVRAMLDQFFKNRLNDSKNATSLMILAKENAIPGFDMSDTSLFQKLVTSWPWRILTTQSTRAKSWLEPLRRIALQTYKDLNVAVAQRDDKQVKHLTTSTHQDNVMRMLKKNQSPSQTYIWRFHREVSPTKVLSIRGTEGHLGHDDPKFGNRLLVHALVKFDTEQSLEIYDKRGKALHKPVDGEPTFGPGMTPAERRRVTEYLVIEKRMWYDGPWVFREQMYEGQSS